MTPDQIEIQALKVEAQALKAQRNQAMDICAKQHAQLILANQEIARLTALLPKEKNRAKKG